MIFCMIPIFISCESVHDLKTADKPEIRSIPGFPRESYEKENINGDFPEAVYIKTRTQSFNTYHYYVLKDGLIWYKGITKDSGPEDWTLFMETGLPHNKKKADFHNTDYIVEISADADELAAISREGQFYRIPFDWIFSRKNKIWYQGQGWPKEEPLYVNERIAGNTGWALGKRNEQVLYYEDIFGNQHHNGTQEIATTYVLLGDGQEICYADTGLPADWSRNYIGPERGAFKAISISSSASTMFVINEAGEMYTRIADFDIIGCDPMFFKYTYIPYKSDVPGTNYKSNLTPWALPGEGWRQQVKIPLEGKAGITKYITILQNGQGNGARELRVAGMDLEGEAGYWTKGIYEGAWRFEKAPLKIGTGDLLDTGKFKDGGASRGTSLDTALKGYIWKNKNKEDGWEFIAENFNLLEGYCYFTALWKNERCRMLLHPVEMWTYLKRDYLPGRSGPPKIFFATLEIPQDSINAVSPAFQEALLKKFNGIDKKLFHYIIEANTDFMLMQAQDSWVNNQIFFLTREGVSNNYPDFLPTWKNLEEDEKSRYQSAEYTIPGGPVFTRDHYADIKRKTDLNIKLREELQRRVDEFDNIKKRAKKSRIAYSAVDFITHITLLFLIDMPKIYTITRFGDDIMSANDEYIREFSKNRIWLDSKIIELLDLRITFYSSMAKQLGSGVREVRLPPGYSDTAAGYWKISELPFSKDGMFKFDRTESRAYIDNAPLKSDFPGWVLKIGEKDNPDFTMLIEPVNVIKTIFDHRGISPRNKSYKFKACLLPISTSISQKWKEFYYLRINPLTRKDRKIKAEIHFDGNTFTVYKKRNFRKSIIFFRG